MNEIFFKDCKAQRNTLDVWQGKPKKWDSKLSSLGSRLMKYYLKDQQDTIATPPRPLLAGTANEGGLQKAGKRPQPTTLSISLWAFRMESGYNVMASMNTARAAAV